MKKWIITWGIGILAVETAVGSEWIDRTVYRLWDHPAGVMSDWWFGRASRGPIWSPTPMYGILPSPLGVTYQIGDRIRSITGEWEFQSGEWKPWPAAGSLLPDTKWVFEGTGQPVILFPEYAIRATVTVRANVGENSAGSFTWHNRRDLEGLEDQWHFEEILDASENVIGIQSRDVWDMGVRFAVYYRKMK